MRICGMARRETRRSDRRRERAHLTISLAAPRENTLTMFGLLPPWLVDAWGLPVHRCSLHTRHQSESWQRRRRYNKLVDV